MSMTVAALAPRALGVLVAGSVTLFLLTRGWPIGPWLLAGLLVAHGGLHLLFRFPAADPEAAAAGPEEPAPPGPYVLGRPWLTRALGLGPQVERGLGTALIAIAVAGFGLGALSTVGVVVPVGWWSGLVGTAAAASLLLLTLFPSPAFLVGYAIDLALLWLVLSSTWSPTASLPVA